MTLPIPEASRSSAEINEIVNALKDVATKKDFTALVAAALQAARVSESVAAETMARIDQVFADPRRIDELFPEGNSQPYFRDALKRLSSISLN